MSSPTADLLRRRIIAHRQVRACDLRPHPLNPRRHPDAQRHILRDLLQEIGLARSVLAYVADADLPLADNAPLTLIDGHMRCEELADTLIEVEVLDVNDAEARALLLALDPLARLADHDAALLGELRSLVEPRSQAVASLWALLDANSATVKQALDEAVAKSELPREADPLPEVYYILIECATEPEQLALLARFQAEGLKCSAKLS